MHGNTETLVPALGATYDFDDIGNRKTATSPILGNFAYTPNSVNQYTAIQTNDTRTVLGTAPVASTVTVNSQSTTRLGTIFSAPLAGNNANPNAPVWLTAAVTDGTTTETRHTWLPASTTAPEYDDDCNLTNDGQWGYLWDAENRLVEMETTPTAVTAGRPYRKLIFAYDWTGRRLARTIHGPNSTVLSATRWLYDGWNPVAEFSDQTTGQTFIRAYLWGMDLSGTMQGAGGVGGLLAVHIHDPQSTIYYPSYDGNGNIVAWTQSGATAPTSLREYDAFGNILIEHGTPPCSIGFSTKPEDPETGLLYYGYRYLSPPLGRWLSRDPIEEQGGLSLYGFLDNDGIGGVDKLGLSPDYLPPDEIDNFERWTDWEDAPLSLTSRCPPTRANGTCIERSFRFYDADDSNMRAVAERLPAGPAEARSDTLTWTNIDNVSQMLRTLDGNLKQCECIKVLTIFAHGTEGENDTLTGGIHLDKKVNTGRQGRALGRILKNVMCENGSIVLPNCGTGESAKDGSSFTDGLADALDGRAEVVRTIWGRTGLIIPPFPGAGNVILVPDTVSIESIREAPGGKMVWEDITGTVRKTPGTTRFPPKKHPDLTPGAGSIIPAGWR